MIKVLYILGSQRGGTTLVGRALGELPGGAFVGEVRKLWEVALPKHHACGCGATHDTCPVWSTIVPPMLEERSIEQLRAIQQAGSSTKRSAVRATGILRRGIDRDALAYADLLSSTYRGLAAALGTDVIIDGSKLPADAAILQHVEGIEPYLLHLVRDPRGVTFSQLSRRAGDRRPHPVHVLHSAGTWILRHGLGNAVRARYGADRSIRVGYEEFVADPNGVIGRVAMLVGTPTPARPLATDGRLDVGVAHTPGGNGRFRPETLELRHDVRWHDGLSRSDSALATAATRPLARRYGYAWSR